MQKDPNRAQAFKNARGMTMNLLKKGMILGSKYDVEVLIVVLTKSSGLYQEYCTMDPQQLFSDMVLASLQENCYQSYTIDDLPTFLGEKQTSENSQEPRKRPRTASPAPSELSSQVSSAPSMRPPAPLEPSKVRPKTKKRMPITRESTISGFLALMQKTQPKPPATLSTTDSLADVPPPPSSARLCPNSPAKDEEETWKDSPSDFLADP